MKISIIDAYNNFHSISTIPPSWGLTWLVFISKSPNVVLIRDFRPIAHCNVLYKILTKTLANRLKLHMTHLIDQEQSAFIKERNI